MTIRWRLAVLALQVAILLVGTWIVLGHVPLGDTWLTAGLLAVVLNRQLLEPFYSKPRDVLANSVIGIVVCLTADRSTLMPGWTALIVLLCVAGSAGLVALAAGANRAPGPGVKIGNVASSLCQVASAQVIYSALFFVSLLATRSPEATSFWVITGLWLGVIVLSEVNWERLWHGLRSSAPVARPEGVIGPGRLLVSAPEVPPVGNAVSLDAGGTTYSATVTGRIRRPFDLWAELHLQSSADAETILGHSSLTVTDRGPDTAGFAGVVDEGTTVASLVFLSNQALRVGSVVSVDSPAGKVLFQVAQARVEERAVRKGAQLVVRVTANQLGIFDSAQFRLRQHPWIVPPGSTVLIAAPEESLPGPIPSHLLRLGTVLDSQIPVFLDLIELCQGHAAILGMTKMGKSTLTHRIAIDLARMRRTVVFDCTGEYRHTHGVEPFDVTIPWTTAGLSVHEPPDTAVRPDFALKCVDALLAMAAPEYAAARVVPRSLIFEEAHDFFPEPASLGFNAPGRDSSYTLGLRMMQVRKYGMSFVLVSQRTAVVSKSALSQCENLVVFRSVDRTGLDYLEDVSGADVRRLIASLRQGEAVAFGPAFSCDNPVAIRIDRPAAPS